MATRGVLLIASSLLKHTKWGTRAVEAARGILRGLLAFLTDDGRSELQWPLVCNPLLDSRAASWQLQQGNTSDVNLVRVRLDALEVGPLIRWAPAAGNLGRRGRTALQGAFGRMPFLVDQNEGTWVNAVDFLEGLLLTGESCAWVVSQLLTWLATALDSQVVHGRWLADAAAAPTRGRYARRDVDVAVHVSCSVKNLR